MGIVIRQSFWTSVITYIGVAIGYINALLLFPAILSTEQIGLIRQVQAAALLLVPIASFGISATTVKYYPEFSKPGRSKPEFFTLMLSGAIVGFLLSFTFLIIFKDPVIDFFAERSEQVNDYFDIIILLLLILVLSAVFESYLRARLNIVFNNFINGVIIRILVGLLVVLYGMDIIPFHLTVKGLVIAYGIAMLSIALFAYAKDPYSIVLKIRDISSSKIRSITNYTLYSILGSAGNVILLNIDILMVTGLAGLSETGIYTTAFYIGIVIELPRRAISQISIPIISTALTEKDLEKVRNHYKRVSINQLIIGGLLFLGILCNLTNIYSLIPNKENFIEGIPVVVIIGIAKMLDMLFSQNSEILMLSKYYRFNVITVIILSVFTIFFNYLLIPEYGIIGAAFASLAAILIFNLVKYSFIKLKMGFHPFSIYTIPLILWIGIVYLIISQIPFLLNTLVDILVRSSLITLLFTAPIYFLKVSPEINDTIGKLIKQLRS